MYISLKQIQISLAKLNSINPFFGVSFLALKHRDLPVAAPVSIDIAAGEAEILDSFFDPVPESYYYFVPMRGGGRRNRWVVKDEFSQSGIQRLRAKAFRDVFVHPGRGDKWAWVADYVARLADKAGPAKIPSFELATWIFRNHDWPAGCQPQDIVNHFFEFFHISNIEKQELFDLDLNSSENLWQDEVIAWKDLRLLISDPPDAPPIEGSGLEYLELLDIGPAKRMELDFAERLNLITGDNGLGKTFLLECAWWALSGGWSDPDYAPRPRNGHNSNHTNYSNSSKPAIKFQLLGNPAQPRLVRFNKGSQTWPPPDEKRLVLPGIVVYAKVDGAYTVWDPAKDFWWSGLASTPSPIANALRLSQNEIWDGLTETQSGRKLCNGLIQDWVDWRYIESETFQTFARVLKRLSPQNEPGLLPGELTKLPRDDRRMPTLQMPYGDVPVVSLSAGMRRILSMAYLLVWAWHSHKEASKSIGKPPQSQMVFLVDEMEAHLHPQWQRAIVPALLDVITTMLDANLQVQLIVATHSPLVMASVEPFYDPALDRLFTLDLVGNEVKVKQTSYYKRGSANAWLTSEVFDLKQAYSMEAEKALLAAKDLQLMDNPDSQQVKEVTRQLRKYLPARDSFWPRWKYFAEEHGATL